MYWWQVRRFIRERSRWRGFNPGHARAGEYAGLTPVTKSATESGGRLASYVDRIVRGEKPAHVGCMQVFRTICYWPARSPSGLPAISIPAAPRGRGRASADLTPSLRNRWFADSPQEGDGFEPYPALAYGRALRAAWLRPKQTDGEGDLSSVVLTRRGFARC